MSKEIYSNGCASFLNANMAATDTTLTVLGGAWPTTGQFTVLCDTEYMLVTAVTGSNPITLTVQRAQEGSVATAHNKGVLIYVNLTDGALRRLARQSVNGVNISTRREINFLGSNVTLTDDPTNDKVDITIAGSSPYTTPPLTGWTLVQGSGNSGSSSNDSSSMTLLETGSTAGGENVKGLFLPIPTTPFKIGALVQLSLPPSSSGSGGGIAFRESSSNKIHSITHLTSNNQQPIVTWGWNDPNTYNGSSNTSAYAVSGPLYLQLGFDGTNLTYALSGDGINYNIFKTAAKNAFFANAPDQIGFFLDTVGANLTAAARLIHWKQT